MDTLVAKYSRPAYAQNEGLTEQDEMDFAEGVPGPSLKFAMPPVAQVRATTLRLPVILAKIPPTCPSPWVNGPSETTADMVCSTHSPPPGSAP